MKVHELIEKLKGVDGHATVYLYEEPKNKYNDNTVMVEVIEEAYDNIGNCIILDCTK